MVIQIATAQDWVLAIGFIILAVLTVVVYVSQQPEKIVLHEHLNAKEIATMKRGYLFGGLWTMKHLHAYAKELDVYFTFEDYAWIIKHVKDDFKEDAGINKAIIITAMKSYIQYHSDKQFADLHERVLQDWHPRTEM